MKMKNKNGFTLVELVVGMTAGVVISLVAMFLYAPVDNFVFTQTRRSGVSGAADAIARILKEVRRLDDPSQITIWSASDFEFVDIDSNTVRFRLSGSNILRDSDVLASDVQSLTFAYLDEDGVVATVVGDIRIVDVEVVKTSGTHTVRLESGTRIRNL